MKFIEEAKRIEHAWKQFERSSEFIKLQTVGNITFFTDNTWAKNAAVTHLMHYNSSKLCNSTALAQKLIEIAPLKGGAFPLMNDIWTKAFNTPPLKLREVVIPKVYSIPKNVEQAYRERGVQLVHPT